MMVFPMIAWLACRQSFTPPPFPTLGYKKKLKSNCQPARVSHHRVDWLPPKRSNSNAWTKSKDIKIKYLCHDVQIDISWNVLLATAGNDDGDKWCWQPMLMSNITSSGWHFKDSVNRQKLLRLERRRCSLYEDRATKRKHPTISTCTPGNVR